MKKKRFKLMALPPSNLEAVLNTEGDAGWEPLFPMMTPEGPVFLLKQVTDEDVSADDIEAERKAAKEAELLAKFGVNPGPTGPRLVK